MIRFSFRRPLLGGIIFAIAMGFSTYIFGEISGFQAWELLATSSSGIITLCYIIILGSIYILVMLLHLLSIKVLKINHLKQKYYNELLNIARLATFLIITSIIVLLLLNIPFTETKIFSYSEYFIIYYTILAVASVLAGGFIAVITMIYQNIRNIIHDKEEEQDCNEAELKIEESIEE
jgi:hypothetical protein